MGFVRDDESPNRIPATVPYTAAFIERPPLLPRTSSRTQSSDEHADRDRPLGVGGVRVPTGRVAEVRRTGRARAMITAAPITSRRPTC